MLGWRLVRLLWSLNASGVSLSYRCPANQAAAASGVPEKGSVVSGVDAQSGAPDADALHVSVVWQEKTPTRIPEAMWFRFTPAADAVDHNSWRLHKIDSVVDPLKVNKLAPC